MKTFNIKIFQSLLAFALALFVFLPHGNSQAVQKITCDRAPQTVNLEIRELTTNATDSMDAVREYAAHVMSLAKFECIEERNCKGSPCKPKLLGIGGLGNFPKPKKTLLGRWLFPKGSLVLSIKCACKTKPLIFEVEEIPLDDIPFDPFLGDDGINDENIEVRGFSRNPDILVYPNPVRSDLKIEFKDFSEVGEYNINIFNSVGTLMENQKVKITESGSYIHNIKAEDYASGIYYVLITDNSNVVTSTKFVVAEE